MAPIRLVKHPPIVSLRSASKNKIKNGLIAEPSVSLPKKFKQRTEPSSVEYCCSVFCVHTPLTRNFTTKLHPNGPTRARRVKPRTMLKCVYVTCMKTFPRARRAWFLLPVHAPLPPSAQHAHFLDFAPMFVPLAPPTVCNKVTNCEHHPLLPSSSLTRARMPGRRQVVHPKTGFLRYSLNLNPAIVSFVETAMETEID